MASAPIEQLIAQAMQHYNTGKLPEAEVLFRQILLQRPNESNALNLLGVIRARSEDYPAALDLFHHAIALNPSNASYHLNLGRVLMRIDKLDEAIASFKRANDLNPNNVNILMNLATALAAQNRADEAIALYQSAIAIKPDFPGAHTNLGNAYLLKRDVEKATASYRRAVQLAPDLPMVHHNLSQALLLSGDFENGLREFDWRVHVMELKLNLSTFQKPMWDGGALNGRRIYLQPEQGFGDFIQMARYIPQVAQRGGRVILGCFEQLAELAQSIPGVEQVAQHGQVVPEFDVYCPLGGLPMRFNTTLQTIPAKVPYLRANPKRIEQWKARVESIDAKLKIGLAWAGRADHRNDRNRSMRLIDLAPLAQLSHAVFFSLQKGEAANQVATSQFKIVDWTSELQTFSDTAALIENLDLVICVDTSVAHLAGAMGKRVWVLLPFNGEWRWLLDREDSPWYPTMKLFRQITLGDWKVPVGRLTQAARELA